MTKATPSATQYLSDRCNGKSEGPDRPPLPPCWVPPCVMCCPSFLERNSFCFKFGGVGCFDGAIRQTLMKVGLCSSVLTMILYIVGAVAVSESADSIKFTSYSAADFKHAINGVTTEYKLHVGLTALVVESPGQADQVIDFKDMCATDQTGASTYVDPTNCDSCEKASGEMVFTAILAVITCLPNIFTDILRMYTNYDVNCQKFWGVFVGMISLLSSLNTFASYSNTCYKSMRTGTFTMADGATVETNWSAGPGFICSVLGTIIKLVDIIIHLIVPTPEFVRNREAQKAGRSAVQPV